MYIVCINIQVHCCCTTTRILCWQINITCTYTSTRTCTYCVQNTDFDCLWEIYGHFNVCVMRLSAVESLLPSPGTKCPSLRRLYTMDMDLDEEKPFFLPSYDKDTKSVSRSVLLSESFTRTFNGYKKIFCKHWYSSAKPRYFNKMYQ